MVSPGHDLMPVAETDAEGAHGYNLLLGETLLIKIALDYMHIRGQGAEIFH